MSTEVAKNETGALTITDNQTWWSQRQQAALAQMGVYNASDADLAVFLQQCQRTGLDPWSKQIYMIGRPDKWNGGQIKQTIQTGIDGFRVIAERSNKYAGQTPVEWCGPDGVWHDVWVSEDKPVAARVGVYRSDFSAPLYATAHFREYNAGKNMWRSIPCHMIAKVAEALALRKAFPHDLSGLYTAEEMDQADTRDQKSAKPQNQQPQPQEQPAVQGAPDPDPEPQPQQPAAAESAAEPQPEQATAEQKFVDNMRGYLDTALNQDTNEKKLELLNKLRNHVAKNLGDDHSFVTEVEVALRETQSAANEQPIENQGSEQSAPADSVDEFDWEGAIEDAERDEDRESLQIYVDTLESQRGPDDRMRKIALSALKRLDARLDDAQQPAAA